MLDGALPNDELFAVIYTIDAGDDWKDPAVLRKANPNFGISVGEEFLLKAQRDAIRYPSRQNSFLTKHLNVWVSARTAWLNMASWHALGDESLKIEDFYGKACWPGVTSPVNRYCQHRAAFPRRSARQERTHEDALTVFVRNYLPAGAVERASTNKAVMNPGSIVAT